MSLTSTTVNYKQPSNGYIIKVLRDYISMVSNNHLTELLIALQHDNSLELCVHYWCNGDDFYLESIVELPNDRYTISELLSIYNKHMERVYDYV